jgi:hypothetical protein
MKRLLLLILLVVSTAAMWWFLGDRNKKSTKPSAVKRVSAPAPVPVKDEEPARLNVYGRAAKKYASAHGFSTNVCFLLDMRLHSGKKRFFIYDLQHLVASQSGLVAHGSCNTSYQESPKFSNQENCGCSSKGKYKVSYRYNGTFGRAFKLYGLDSTNSNAFARFIVLHGYECVPDEETYPAPICNSLGCPMVSNNFLRELDSIIARERRPILLWMFN